MSPCSIRPATRDDAETINDIQNHYVASSTATFLTEPVALEQRLTWLEGRSLAHPVIVAQAAGSVVGWGSLEVFRARPAYRHTAEFSLYVHPEWHRRGIGRALLTDLVARARNRAPCARRRVLQRIDGRHRAARSVGLLPRRSFPGGRPQVRSLARRRIPAETSLAVTRFSFFVSR